MDIDWESLARAVPALLATLWFLLARKRKKDRIENTQLPKKPTRSHRDEIRFERDYEPIEPD